MNVIFDSLRNNRAIKDFLDEYGPQLKKMAVICLLGLVIFAGFSLFQGRSDSEITPVEKSGSNASGTYSDDGADVSAEAYGNGAETSERTYSDGTIYVDIGGAVKNPMLAELPDGSRVDDAIKAAGGLRKEADMTSINRAEFLVDGQKIFIPSYALDEEGNVIESAGAPGVAESADAQTNSSGATSGNGSREGKVNINTADSDQLQTLNGVGPATAQKIIDYRDSSGRFTSIDDLKNVSGIGDKTFEKLKDFITV